jgi:hypothetical protein
MNTKSLPVISCLCVLALLLGAPTSASAMQTNPDPLATNVLMETAGLLGLDTSPDCTSGMCAWLDPLNNTLTYEHPSGKFTVFLTVFWLSDYDSPLAWVSDTLGTDYTEYDLDYGSRAYFLETMDESWVYDTGLIPCGSYGMIAQVTQALAPGGSLPERMQPDIWMALDALDNASNRWGLCAGAAAQPETGIQNPPVVNPQPEDLPQTATDCSWDDTRMATLLSNAAWQLGWSETPQCGNFDGLTGYCCVIMHEGSQTGKSCSSYSGGPIAPPGSAQNNESQTVQNEKGMLVLCQEGSMMYVGPNDVETDLFGQPAQWSTKDWPTAGYSAYHLIWWDQTCGFRLESGAGFNCRDYQTETEADQKAMAERAYTYASTLYPLAQFSDMTSLTFNDSVPPTAQPSTTSSGFQLCTSGMALAALAASLMGWLRARPLWTWIGVLGGLAALVLSLLSAF